MIVTNATSASSATSTTASTSATKQRLTGAASKPDFAEAFAEFKKLADESPIERIKDAVLKEHGMSKDDFNKMPDGPDKRAIQKAMDDALKRKLGVDGKNTTIALMA